MTTITVTTQAELDAALAEHGGDPSTLILIDSPRGVWLKISNSGSATVRAYGRATVEAYGSATVMASGWATVRAYGSATVMASGWATVRAYGSATVMAYGRATVEASDSATVMAYGWATVRAYGSATVRAYGSATVEASDSATVEASRYVAVHIHSAHVTLSGGVVIDLTSLDLDDPPTWADYTGARVTDGLVTLYKAVDANLCAGHDYRLTRYPIGEDVTAPDWRDNNSCGHGLHASPHPHQAAWYHTNVTGGGAMRMLEVTVPLADVRPIGEDKAKAEAVHVVREVALDGSSLPEGGAA